MKTDPLMIFSEKTQENCVKEIISTLKNEDLPSASFKVDFNLSKGKMISEEDHNTVLSFDTKENTSLREVIEYICEADNINKEDIESFESFRKSLIQKLNEEFLSEATEEGKRFFQTPRKNSSRLMSWK